MFGDWLSLVVLVLAVFRLTRMLVDEEGPGDVFALLRQWAGCYEYGHNGRPVTQLGRILSCPYCAGVWVAVFLVALSLIPYVSFVVYWLAVAGGQVLILDFALRTGDGVESDW